jgi:hypothetical protein
MTQATDTDTATDTGSATADTDLDLEERRLQARLTANLDAADRALKEATKQPTVKGSTGQQRANPLRVNCLHPASYMPTAGIVPEAISLARGRGHTYDDPPRRRQQR